MALRLAVNEAFGYGHLSVDWCIENNVDAPALAKENEWSYQKGQTVHGFSKDKFSKIDWSQNYTKEDLKELAKQQKKQTK